MRLWLGRLLIATGLICFIISLLLFWQRNNPQRLAFAVSSLPSQKVTKTSSSQPVEIIIKDVDIDLPIFPAQIHRGKWEASTLGVSYLSSSPIPGESGNSILYGHNWPNLLGRITKLKPGQNIEIKFADHSVKNFIIEYTFSVSPQETTILNPSPKPQITLYTCTGFLDSQRFVVVAKLK